MLEPFDIVDVDKAKRNCSDDPLDRDGVETAMGDSESRSP